MRIERHPIVEYGSVRTDACIYHRAGNTLPIVLSGLRPIMAI